MDQQRLKLKMHVFFIIILALLATMVFLLNISAGSVNISLEHIIN
ncbi:hypothetical protein [Dehalobacter restrictus]